MLKKEININREKITICVLFVKINESSFVGKKPPEDIIVIAKFKELNALIPNTFKIIKIKIVRDEYSKNIFNT